MQLLTSNVACLMKLRLKKAIKSLGENKYCTKTIVDVSRTILEHHHGDKFEDLCFIDSSTNKSLSKMDYRERKQEVLPTKAMKQMAINNPNIISIHNHPTDALPSYEDVKTCYLIGYKYGLVICHGGSIYQYNQGQRSFFGSYTMHRTLRKCFLEKSTSA